MPEELHNLQGQKMGRKGRETRRRIMDVTLALLQDSSYKDLTVLDVVYEADVSNATFYIYFEDIEDVLFACVQEAALDMNAILDVLATDWNRRNLRQKVREFVESYNQLWEKNRVELRLRNLEADQGNPRFLHYRTESTRKIYEALGRKITELNPGQRNPDGVAIVIFAALDIIAAKHEIGIVSGATRQTRKKLTDAIVDLLSLVLENRA